MADDKAPDKARYEVPSRNHSTMVVKLTPEEAEALYGDSAKRVGDARQAQPQPVGVPPYAGPVPAPGESVVSSDATDDGDRSSASDAAPKRRTTAPNKARAT